MGDGYAGAILEISKAEDQLERVEDELFQVARGLEGSEELRESLTDNRIPAERRVAIVEDLIAGKASPLTLALVELLIKAGRAKDFSNIVDRFLALAAAERQKALAEVRSAVPLPPQTVARLEQALSRATRKDVEVKVVVDATIGGGIVATVGDIVIDGSVRSRLEQLRQTLR